MLLQNTLNIEAAPIKLKQDIQNSLEGRDIHGAIRYLRLKKNFEAANFLQKQLDLRPVVQDKQPQDIKQELGNFTLEPTRQDESLLEPVRDENKSVEFPYEQQNVDQNIQTEQEVKQVVEKEMQSVEQQVEQMPDQIDDEIETLRAQVEQMKSEKHVVQQKPGEVKKPPFNRPLEWLTPGGLIMGTVHGVGSLVKKIFGK